MTWCVKKRRDLSDEERVHLFMLLLKDFNGTKLVQGSIKKHAESHFLSCKTVSRLWELGNKFILNGEVVDLAKKLSKHVGRKKIQIDTEFVKTIPYRRRKTMDAMAHALEVSKTTVHRRVKEGLFRRHSNAIKPELTNENKKARLRFCLSMLEIQFNGQYEILGGLNQLGQLQSCLTNSENEPPGPSQLHDSSSQTEVTNISSSEISEIVRAQNGLVYQYGSSLVSYTSSSSSSDIHSSSSSSGSSFVSYASDINPRFEVKFLDMFNYVIIDEKWFYLSKETEKYYLTADEMDPERSCKSKKFITKVMFLAAVARPRFDDLGNVLFDGKIGIYPFTYQEPAKRKSKNRAAGTLETKPILAVTKDVSREWLIEKVLPSIREKWPVSSRRSTIFIQQDNARPHIKPSDDEFTQASRIDGFDIQLTCQPPNSPDLNVLDLGYFRAIQSLQYQEAPRDIDELIAAVNKSFYELSANSLNRVFLTQHSCMMEIMKCGGGNNYTIPHLNKERMAREGRLPLNLACNFDVVQNAVDHLVS